MFKTRASTVAHASTLSCVEFINENIVPKTNEAMQTGTILHSLILEEKLPETLIVLDYKDYRTKSSQDERNKILADGKIPLLKKDLEPFLSIDLTAVKSFFRGYDVEISKAINYKNKAIITGILDAFNGKHVKDLKITASKNFNNLTKEIFYRGYDIQLFLYMLMSGVNTASNVFFNVDTGIVQEVDMHINDIKDSCMYRIENKSFVNLQALENYKNGMRVLENLQYYPLN